MCMCAHNMHFLNRNPEHPGLFMTSIQRRSKQTNSCHYPVTTQTFLASTLHCKSMFNHLLDTTSMYFYDSSDVITVINTWHILQVIIRIMLSLEFIRTRTPTCEMYRPSSNTFIQLHRRSQYCWPRACFDSVVHTYSAGYDRHGRLNAYRTRCEVLSTARQNWIGSTATNHKVPGESD